jgi:hypothetical protein
MSEDFKCLRRAEIRLDRQQPGSVRKILIDSSGSREFPKFVRLEVFRDGSGGYYLFHISADGFGTDTRHGSLDEVLDEAEAEYGVGRKAWQEIT